MLTIISLPCNAGIAVQTTCVRAKGFRPYRSPERLERELRLGSAGWEFQPMLHTSLTAFTDVLSSVTAFSIVRSIIGKKGDGVKGEIPERSGEALFDPKMGGYHLIALNHPLAQEFC